MDDEYDYSYRFQVQQESEKLAEARMNTMSYKLERFGIRCARIACGIALIFGSIIVIGNIQNVSDTPFSELTIGALVKNIGGWIFGLGLIWWAFVAAFGASPKKSDIAKKLIGEAEVTVRAARDRARMNT